MISKKKKKKTLFTEFLRDFLAEIRNSNVFSGRKHISKRKRSLSQKCYEIRCQSTKITKIPVANTNLGLDLHSSSPEQLFSLGNSPRLGGHNFCLGGHKQSFGGARPQNVPPWRRACYNFTKLQLSMTFHSRDISDYIFFLKGVFL